MSYSRFIIFIILTHCSFVLLPAKGLNDTLRTRIYFPVAKADLEYSFRDNGKLLNEFFSEFELRKGKYFLREILLKSGSSPEGPRKLNRELSDKRLDILFGIIQQKLSLPDSIYRVCSIGEDWDGLYNMVANSDMKYKNDVLKIIEEVPELVFKDKKLVDSRKKQLMNLHGGKPWNYMLHNFFPNLRHSSVVECVFEPMKVNCQIPNLRTDTLIIRDTIELTKIVKDTIIFCPEKPHYFALKTNLLYDALMIPNIGIEIHVGKRWSITGDWMYAWWKNENKNRFWRIYGGDLGLRKYFGKKSLEKPLTGHHIGLYGYFLTYDFELGGKGYIGGKPGKSLFERGNYGGGIEYGYSLPIKRRLNLDFAVGIGYIGGLNYEYIPIEGFYVWQKTKQKNWIGPTKAEVSLVWLLGKGNFNNK